MFIPKTITEQLLFSTIRIESGIAAGNSVGTGFIFNIRQGENTIPVILTNKHVIKDSIGCSLFFHETTDKVNPSDDSFNLRITCEWIDHPDPEVDLAATLIGPIIHYANDRLNKNIFFRGFDSSLIWTDEKLSDELGAVEDILMVGYPRGLWDSKNNLPLVRKGITSSHPAIDFENKSIGVIDAACFPGSSGSPILIVNEGSYRDKKGNAFFGSSRFLLLGALFEGPTIGSKGEIVIEEIPTGKTAFSNHQIMMNLGYYIKAKEILVLEKEIIKKVGAKK